MLDVRIHALILAEFYHPSPNIPLFAYLRFALRPSSITIILFPSLFTNYQLPITIPHSTNTLVLLCAPCSWRGRAFPLSPIPDSRITIPIFPSRLCKVV